MDECEQEGKVAMNYFKEINLGVPKKTSKILETSKPLRFRDFFGSYFY